MLYVVSHKYIITLNTSMINIREGVMDLYCVQRLTAIVCAHYANFLYGLVHYYYAANI